MHLTGGRSAGLVLPLTAPIRLFADLVTVTAGTTVRDEILGDGDPTATSQAFVLQHSPLIYLPPDSSRAATGEHPERQRRRGSLDGGACLCRPAAGRQRVRGERAPGREHPGPASATGSTAPACPWAPAT